MIFYCKKGLFFFTKIVIVLLTINEVSGVDQKISFFVTEDCSGKNISFGDTQTNLAQEVKSSKSFLVEYGAWRVYETGMENSSSDNKENSTTGQKEKDNKSTTPKIWMANITNKTCRSKSMSLERIERIGERDLDSDTLTLYSGVNYAGKSTVVNETISYENWIEFKSWAITGERSWAAFKEKDFQGELICLEPSSSKYGVALSGEIQKASFLSVRKGCNGSCSLKAFSNLILSSIIFIGAIKLI